MQDRDPARRAPTRARGDTARPPAACRRGGDSPSAGRQAAPTRGAPGRLATCNGSTVSRAARYQSHRSSVGMVNCGCASKTHADIDLHADTAGGHGRHNTKVAPPTTSRVATEAGTTQPGPLSLKESRPDALTTNANYGVRKSSEEDDCGVSFVGPSDTGQQVTDAADDVRHACGPLGSDHVAVALTLAILFQHTVRCCGSHLCRW